MIQKRRTDTFTERSFCFIVQLVPEETNGAERRESALWMFALVIIALLCHGSALRGWWTYDDPQLLLHAIKVTAIDALSTPDRYQTLATHTFTPLLPLSFKIDLALAGLRPLFHYVHQVASLTLASLLFFALLRRYVRVRLAFAGAALFLCSWPAVYAARALMIRHYVEGLVFALIALIAFSHRTVAEEKLTPRDRTLLDLTGSFFYLLAILEKELYVPLPLFLLLQSRANGERWIVTLRRLIAPALALSIFLGWRTYMLGSGGGFTSAPSLDSIARLPLKISTQLAGPTWQWPFVVMAMILFAFGLLALRRHPKESGAIVAVSMIVALLPIVTLADNFEWRYVFAIGVIAAALVAFALEFSGEHHMVEPVAFALVALLFVASIFQAKSYAVTTQPSIAEGKYLYSQPSDARFLRATATSWYLAGIAEIRTLEGRSPAPPFACSLLPFIVANVNPATAVEYSPREHRFVLLSAVPVIDAERLKEESTRPFSIELRKEGDLLHWSFKSREPARWSYVAMPTWLEIPIPPVGERRIPEAYGDQSFRVVVRFNDGRWGITPELPVPRDGDRRLWQRGAM